MIDNTVVKVLNDKHREKIIEYFRLLGVDVSRELHSEFIGVINNRWDGCNINYFMKNNNLKAINLPLDKKEELNTPKHYNNNTKTGTLYNVAMIRNWNAYLFDIVKRLERAEEKGEFDSDLEKSINVIKLWQQERNNNK